MTTVLSRQSETSPTSKEAPLSDSATPTYKSSSDDDSSDDEKAAAVVINPKDVDTPTEKSSPAPAPVKGGAEDVVFISHKRSR